MHFLDANKSYHTSQLPQPHPHVAFCNIGCQACHIPRCLALTWDLFFPCNKIQGLGFLHLFLVSHEILRNLKVLNWWPYKEKTSNYQWFFHSGILFVHLQALNIMRWGWKMHHYFFIINVQRLNEFGIKYTMHRYILNSFGGIGVFCLQDIHALGFMLWVRFYFIWKIHKCIYLFLCQSMGGYLVLS